MTRASMLEKAGLVAGLASMTLAIEYGRLLAAREPGWSWAALLAGGAALCLLAGGYRLLIGDWRRLGRAIGLDTRRLVPRAIAGLGLAAVLLLPAAARWGGGPALPPAWALAAVVVSVGEEVAFRGVLFAALEDAAGGPLAVAGTTLLWTAAHALSHPLAFLPAVAGAGLILGMWRLVFRDLVAPTVAHVLADLAL